MYLKKLEIHGFKSFAKKTSFAFEPGITSIVGPNGSGKSNLADALRWVFGEQSLKLLRGKKSEDVIFAGSSKRPRMGGAEVKVYFDNTDHIMPLDYQEAVIERRLFRDGNSEYLINANQVRLLDIEELLAKSGFGNTSYCVIGQGMIDQLILGGAGAVKELVEEAARIKPYYLKRERTLRRLEHTENNLSQVKALVAEIEPRLKSLRRQTKKLERRADVEKELSEVQAQYYAQIFRGLMAQIREVSGKEQIFEKQIAELTLEIKNLRESIEKQEETSETQSEAYKKLRRDLEETHKQKLKIQEELATIKGKLKVEPPAVSSNLAIDWRKLKAKFQEAYQRLKGLIKRFTEGEAFQVEKLFAEVSDMLESADTASSLAEYERERVKLIQAESRFNQQLGGLIAKITALEDDLKSYTDQEEQGKQQLFVRERLLRNKQETLVKTSGQKNLLSIEKAKLQTRREAYQQETEIALGAEYEKKIAEVDVSGPAPLGLQEKIISLKKQLEIIGGVDDLTIQEHKETEERYQYLTNQTADLEKGVKDLRQVISELDEVIKKEFDEAYGKISEKFSEYFRILFGGGKAVMTILREKQDLPFDSPPREEGKGEVIGDEDQPGQAKSKPEITGIEIRATPPGKKLAGIAALSGGERALTSIALLCALLASYPSPFVVLDEVDAALDEANSIRFGKILETLAHKTQFITVTHNRETMRQSHTLYGVTMGEDGVSKVLSLKLEQAAVYSSKN
ncbi:MAG: AAA family ATPase [Candidatus Doudnabacteria bacterium]|nr:AAA family ATPase [Candidatus Doudnabacteria bacterium]